MLFRPFCQPSALGATLLDLGLKLHTGGSFPSLAAQYSSSPPAQRGGRRRGSARQRSMTPQMLTCRYPRRKQPSDGAAEGSLRLTIASQTDAGHPGDVHEESHLANRRTSTAAARPVEQGWRLSVL